MNRQQNNKNYAQAAAQPKSHINHQNQQHHHQQSSQQNQTSGNPTSSNFSPSANGKPNKSQTKPQAQHNSTMGNGSIGRSAPIKQKNPVQLPTNGHAWEKAPPIEFGSVNTPSSQLSTSTGPTLTSGGGLPATLPTKAVPSFGTLSNTTTQHTQAIQAIQASTTVGTTSPGANNNNSNSNNNNNNNGVSKSISSRGMEIPRTHSAPPQFQDNRNVGQSGHIPNAARTQPNNIHQQQPAVVSHQPPSVSVSNPPLNNHRKDSVSSTVSSNDGQQQSFHPHHSTHHPPNHRQHYQHQHQHHKNNNIQPNQFRPPRDKNLPHLNSQPVPTQGSIPMGPHIYPIYNRADYAMPYYPYVVYPPYAMAPPRPQITQPHIPPTPPANNNYKNTVVTPAKLSKAIEIIDPLKGAPISFQPQLQPKIPHKREEPVTVFDKKPEESDKEKPSSEDKSNNSKAVPIVDPAEKDKEERERKEQERIAKEKEKAEQERKEREEVERLEAERKEKEEKERKEREEKERREREEREERERLEKEKKEREEKERKEREEKERLEKEKKEKEEKERKEREERERLEKEKKEREEKERKEREEKERLEKEKKEREEKERKEREERERLEREEKERKEREEKERLEKEKKEREEKERKEREEKERLEKERLETERKEEEERARKQQEEKEKEEAERKKKEEEEAKAKAASEDEKKKEAGSGDSKKEEKKFNKGHRPGPLDLSRTTSAPAIPSALGSARIIDDLNSVQYPEGILSPNPALNSNAEPGKFKYDRSFLMQFMGVCKEKPENLPALEAIGMEEPKDDKKRPTRNGTGPRSLHKGSPTQFQMGEFKSPLKTSEERFAVSNMRNGASGAGIFGRATLGRTGSGSTLLPAPAMPITTTQSPGRSPSSGRVAARRSKGSHQVQGPNVGQEQVAPLERSENRWVPPQMSDSLSKTNESSIPMEGIQRKVKALLNKLTLEKFDSISDQIIDYANKSRDEKDGRILKEVIRLIFEKSCDESNFCAMYAQLCRKMMERVDPEIVDENVKNTEGKFVQGGTLFRKYLLNRCQEDFEKGWKVNVPVPSNEKGEPDLMSDEYYAAAKAKRQGLGLIRFIGELFKLNMLTERIMHECIKKLLIFQGSPEEEEMESLCKLMNTVGEQLDHVKTNPHEHIKQNQIDHAKAKQLMESYFNRMEEISKLPNLSSRIKFMIMDVIDLRNNSWKPRRDINAPKTIAEIHEDAAKQKEEAEFLRRTASSGGRLPKMAEQMSRSGSGRREHRDKGMSSHGSSASSNDGWNVVGTSQRNKDKVGDLTKFGSITRGKITGSFSLAPGGLPLSGGAKGWNNEKDGKNIYSVLTTPESSEGRKSSETPSSEVQKSSPPMERRRIILAPRTKAIPSEESQTTAKSAPKSNSEAASSVQSMPEELATKKINGMIEEYLSIRDIKEVTQCLKEIPAEYHARAIESFANKVIEQKPKDVENVMKLFKELSSSGTCELDAFKNGFKATLDFLMEIGADAPMAYSFTGQLLFSTGLDFRDITKLLGPLDDDKAIEKIVGGYASALKKDDEQKYVQKIREFDFISLFPKKNKDDINKYLEDLVR